jgi:hypothetical protein
MYANTAQMSQGLGAQLFQPESQYNAQLVTANRKEAMDAQIANAQSRNALTSGLMGMAGAVGGAFLGNPALFGATTALGGGGGGNLGSMFSASSGGTSLSGGLNLGDYKLGGGGLGLQKMSGGGFKF